MNSGLPHISHSLCAHALPVSHKFRVMEDLSASNGRDENGNTDLDTSSFVSDPEDESTAGAKEEEVSLEVDTKSETEDLQEQTKLKRDSTPTSGDKNRTISTSAVKISTNGVKKSSAADVTVPPPPHLSRGLPVQSASSEPGAVSVTPSQGLLVSDRTETLSLDFTFFNSRYT